MKKRVFVLIMLIALVLSSCGTPSDYLPDDTDVTPSNTPSDYVPDLTDAPSDVTPDEDPTSTPAKKEIKVLGYSFEKPYNGFSSQVYDTMVNFLPRLLKDHGILPDYKVIVETVNIKQEDFPKIRRLLLEDLRAGKGPDVIIGAEAFFDDLPALAREGLLSDLSQYAYPSMFNSSTLSENAFKSGSIGDALYYFPLALSVDGGWAVPYNKARDLGVNKYDDTTLDQFIKDMNSDGRNMSDYVWRDADTYYPLDLFGLRAYDAVTRTSYLDTVGFKDGLNTIKDFMLSCGTKQELSETLQKVQKEIDYMTQPENEVYLDYLLNRQNGVFTLCLDEEKRLSPWNDDSKMLNQNTIARGDHPVFAHLPRVDSEAVRYANPLFVAMVNKNCTFVKESIELIKLLYDEGTRIYQRYMFMSGIFMLNEQVNEELIHLFQQPTSFGQATGYPHAGIEAVDVIDFMVPYADSYYTYFHKTDDVFVRIQPLEDMLRQQFIRYLNDEISIDEFVAELSPKFLQYFDENG